MIAAGSATSAKSPTPVTSTNCRTRLIFVSSTLRPQTQPGLRECNVHYALRKARRIDGFKPFLKGFTAASCRSNIIVPRDESDARYYLGSDYPFILKDESLNAVLEMIEHAKSSFAGAEWRRGLEIMESVRQRCDPTQIASQLKALLARCR